MGEVAKILKDHTRYFVVVSIEEALMLRARGIKNAILVLGNYDGSDKRAFCEAVSKNIELAVYSAEVLKHITAATQKAAKQALVHIKIDTGMSRFGVPLKEAIKFIYYAAKLKEIQIRGIYSHFAASDENEEFTRIQADRFGKNLAALKKKNISIPHQHIRNTAGSFLEDIPGNAARVGIGLYGLYPSLWSKQAIQKRNSTFFLQPALSWKTKIIQIKEVEKGTGVSYGCTYTVKEDSRLALVPVGYWDGYDRGLSNRGVVLVCGKRVPVVGRVCMNQTIVDVSNIPRAYVGQEVVLLGKSGRETITADDIAKLLGTINYEVVTRINPLIPRKVV